MNSDAHIRSGRVIDEALKSVGALKNLDPQLWNELYERISQRSGKIVLTGVGKSGYIAMKVAATLTSLGHFSVFVHPIEAMHGDMGGVGDGDVVIAFSFSGGTKELIHFLRHVRNEFEVTLIGVTGNTESILGKLSDVVVPVTIEEEGCPLNLAPMASTTAMLVIGDTIAAGITSPEAFTKRDFARFHPSGTLGYSLTYVHEKMFPQSPDDMVWEETSLQQALVRMSEIGKGLVGVVTPEGVLKGAITDGDIRRFFLENSSLEGAYAKDVMTADPKCLQKEQTLKDALSIMEDSKITNVFVVDERGIPIGILHLHDILSS